MKYIDAEKLKAEIKKRRFHFNKEAEKYQALNNGYSQNCYGARDALRDLENFINSLQQEQPSLPDLDEAAMDIVIKMHPCLKYCTVLGDRLTRGQLMALVKAGAEWAMQQLKGE